MSQEQEFRNVAPRGRMARAVDKDALEKERLKNRHSGFVKYESEVIDNPFSYAPNTTGYISDAERFHTDVAGEEKRARDAKLAAERARIERKREVVTQKEEQRWQREEQTRERDLQKVSEQREAGTKTKNVQNSVPYNPITLKYNDGLDGDRLKYHDDMAQFRCAQRSKNLQSRMDGAYNPITGEQRRDVQLPPQPSMPEKLAGSPYKY